MTRDEEIFADAVGRPAHERAAFLDGACGSDSAQRARIEALLRADQDATGFMAAAPGRDLARDLKLLAPPEETPGQPIGRYKLLQKIGEGGCGIVWMAEQQEPVRRRVALKVIKLGMDTKAVVARFEAERQALAMMDHPNIAKVLDAGATETGRPFFVMELVRGIPITKYCDENQLTPTDRLELFIKVCQAIQHAHQKGVIHRDIKPSNILVTVNDGQPTPKVIDFGIAKATQGRLTDATIFTAFEQFIGTPAYMSPEQAEMSSLDIDTRSDIYSLGVLLYELLSGKPPFDPKKFAQAGVDQIRQQIREAEPPRPSARLSTLTDDEQTTIARLRATAPSQLSLILRGDLDWIVMRCIEKDRTRRYDTANGLATDIQRYLRNEPVVARPPSTAYLLQKLIRRHRVAVGAAVAIFVALAAGLAISTWSLWKEKQSRDRAVTAEREQSRLRGIETELRRKAERQELAARHRAYASDIIVAQQALTRGNWGEAQRLLDRQRPTAGASDLRGWEWRYLWQLCRSEATATLAQKPNEIRSLSVSADGKWLAIVDSVRGGLAVLNLQSRLEMPMPIETGVIRATFSPKEPLLAIAIGGETSESKRDSAVLLWNIATQRVVKRLQVSGPSRGLFFSSDGDALLSVTSEVTRWRVADGENLGSSPLPLQDVDWLDERVATSARLEVLAYFRFKEVVTETHVLNLSTHAEHWRANATDETIRTVALSPDGKVLATGAGHTDSTLRLWEIESDREIRRLEGHTDRITALTFWPDGKRLASASADQTIRIWDIEESRLLRTLRGHTAAVVALALLPDDQTLVSGGKDGSVLLWDTSQPPPRSVKITLPRRMLSWRFLPDKPSLLTVDFEGRITRWDTETLEQTEVMNVGPFLDAGLADNAPLVATSQKDGSVTVWNWEQKTRIARIESVGRNPDPWDFLEDGKKLMVMCDGEIHELDLPTAKIARSWPTPRRRWGAVFSPDEQRGLCFDTDGAALLINRTTGELSRPSLQFGGAALVNFSPDGKRLAASSDRGTLRIWDEAFREIATLDAFSWSARSVEFSPDGRRLAAGGSGTEAVKLWDTYSYDHLLTLEAPGAGFWVSFSPDGNWLGILPWPGNLTLWRAPSWAEIEAAEKAQAVSAQKP